MKVVAVTKFKAKISVHLDRVKGGEDLVITEHGQPIAHVSSVKESGRGRLLALHKRLIAKGILRPPRAHISKAFVRALIKGNAAPQANLSGAILDEREESF